MAATDEISSFFLLNDIKVEKDLVLEYLNQVYDSIKKINATKVDLDKAGNFKSAGEAIGKLKTQLDETEKAQRRLEKAQADGAIEAAKLKIQIQQQEKANKQAALEALGMVDAYKKLSQEYDIAARKAKNLAATYGEHSAVAKEAASSAKVLSDRLKFIDDSVGQNTRNVGNYSSVWEKWGQTGKNVLGKINDGFGGLIKNVAAFGVSFLGIQGLFEFGKSALETFEKSEQSSSRLNNALHNLGASAADIKKLNDSVRDLGTGFGYLTKFDIVEAQQKLVTYGKLTTDQITALLPTIANFAANARIGITEATDIIIKGLEGNSRALKLYGLDIKGAGDEAGRFNLIQTELADKVAGAGKAFADTSEGQAQVYKNQLVAIKTQLGEQLMPVYEQFLKTSIGFLSVLKTIDIGNVVKGFASLTAIWLAYKVAVLASTVAQQLNNGATLQAIILEKEYTITKADGTKATVEYSLVTKAVAAAKLVWANITRLLTFEFRLLNTEIKLSPIGIFIGVITIAVGLFSALSARAAETANQLRQMKVAMQTTKEVMQQANDVFASQKQVIEELVKKINDHTLSLDERKKTLKELIALDPDYLNGLTLENIETEKGVGILDRYIEALQKKAIEEAAYDIRKQNAQTRIKAQVEQEQENKQYKEVHEKVVKQRNETVTKSQNDFGGNQGVSNVSVEADNQLKYLEDKHKDLNAEWDKTIDDSKHKDDALDEIIKKNTSTAKFKQKSGVGKYGGGGDDGDKNKNTTDYGKDAFKEFDEASKAAFDAWKVKQEDQKTGLKQIIEDEKNSFNQRLAAAQDYYQKSLSLLKDHKKFDDNEGISKIAEDRREVNEKLKKDKLTTKQREDLYRQLEGIDEKARQQKNLRDAKYNSEIGKLNAESEKQITDIVKSEHEKQQKIREEAVQKQIDAAQRVRDATLSQVDEQTTNQIKHELFRYQKGEINKRQYEEKIKEIENEARKLSLLAEIDYQKTIIEISNLPEDKKKKALQDLAKVEKQLRELSIKEEKDATDQKIKDTDKYHEFVKKTLTDLGHALKNSFFSILDSGIERQKNALQQRIDGIDALAQKEIDAINSSLASEQDKAAKISILNARAAAEKEQLVKKQKQLDQQKAVFEKAKTITEIIERTALAVVTELGDDTIPGPARIPLAIAIGAIGAAELATVIAQPIPKYFDGTEDHPGGLALVGDAYRSELVITPSGELIKTPNKPTVIDLPKHSIVLPELPSPDMLLQMANGEISFNLARKSNESDVLNGSIKRLEKSVVNAIQKIPQTNIVAENVIRKWVRSQGGSRDFLNRY